MVKIFAELEIGDKIFEISENGETSIYEIQAIEDCSGPEYTLNFVLGYKKRTRIGIGYRTETQPCFVSNSSSIIVSDEQLYLKFLEKLDLVKRFIDGDMIALKRIL